MPKARVVLLTRASDSGRLVFHALDRAGFDVRVLIEEPPARWRLLRMRAAKQGYLTVLGQLLFQVCVAVPLARRSRRYRAELVQRAGASLAPLPTERVHATIKSVNKGTSWELVRALAPDIVVINGTRILSAKTIEALGKPVLNMHAGITPRYRGVHGGYWALAMRDAEHCGVTVHLVDAGVDTGTVLAQRTIAPGPKDDFSTYPTLQALAGLPLLVQAVQDVHAGKNIAAQVPSGDRRWFHPTLFAYLRYRITRGVR